MSSMQAFFADQAKTRVSEAIKQAELATSAEVVVTLRAQSASYRDIELMVGVAVSLLALLVLTFHPDEFNEDLFPLWALLAVVLSALLVGLLPSLKRLLISRKRRQAEAAQSARAAFVELGVHRTTGRSGVLLFISALERELVVVPDVGIDERVLGASWRDLREKLSVAVAQGDLDGFVAGVAAIGPALSDALPRAADDVNELPDEVH